METHESKLFTEINICWFVLELDSFVNVRLLTTFWKASHNKKNRIYFSSKPSFLTPPGRENKEIRLVIHLHTLALHLDKYFTYQTLNLCHEGSLIGPCEEPPITEQLEEAGGVWWGGGWFMDHLYPQKEICWNTFVFIPCWKSSPMYTTNAV